MRNYNLESLQILQYNTHKARAKVIIPLLADEKTQAYDILAIQEPWRNEREEGGRTYNPGNGGFHVVYQTGESSRVCFYVNKRLAPDSWSAAFPSPDVSVLTIH